MDWTHRMCNNCWYKSRQDDPVRVEIGKTGKCCSLIKQNQSSTLGVFDGAGQPTGLEGENSIMDAPTLHEATLLSCNCCRCLGWRGCSRSTSPQVFGRCHSVAVGELLLEF